MAFLVSAAVVVTVHLSDPDYSVPARWPAASSLLVQQAWSMGRPKPLTDTEREELEDILRRKDDIEIKNAEERIKAKMHPGERTLSSPQKAALKQRAAKGVLHKFRPSRPSLDMWSFAKYVMCSASW